MSDPARQITVLLVDDQRIIGEAVRRLLVDEPDIRFDYCVHPEKAVSRANEIHPDVILQDMVMPDIDGPAMVRLFRANVATANTAIIVLSGSEDPESKLQAFAAGANDYVVKLPDKAELIATIRRHSGNPQ
jgi:PleD family two-component response regulator